MESEKSKCYNSFFFANYIFIIKVRFPDLFEIFYHLFLRNRRENFFLNVKNQLSLFHPTHHFWYKNEWKYKKKLSVILISKVMRRMEKWQGTFLLVIFRRIWKKNFFLPYKTCVKSLEFFFCFSKNKYWKISKKIRTST